MFLNVRLGVNGNFENLKVESRSDHHTVGDGKV